MTEIKIHPVETELADYLGGRLRGRDKRRVEEHLSSCDDCLASAVAAYEAVAEFEKEGRGKKGRKGAMKRINPYLALAIIAFALSFGVPRFFLQFLVATLLLGAKWVVDSKTTRMLVMIHEAWKRGGEKDVSRLFGEMDGGMEKPVIRSSLLR